MLGCQEIFGEDDAFWIDGIEVEKRFYDLVSADLLAAINQYRFDFQTETFVARPAITATPNKLQMTADGIDTFVLTGLPIGCKITISDTNAETDDIVETVGEDGEIGFPTAIPDTYQVTAELWPYQSKTWEVTAI